MVDEFSTSPWNQEPIFALLPGFHLRMISVDILHAWHLGVGRDVIGSVLRCMAKGRFWPGSNLEKQLQHASGELRAYARAQKLSLQLKKLTKSNLNWVSDGYPECHCKGYDTYVILKWLNHALQGCDDQNTDLQDLDDLKTLVWTADSILSVWSNAGMFLTAQQAFHIEVMGGIFMRTFIKLAANAVQRRQRLWRCRPKLHLVHHLLLDRRASRYNPHYMSTWLDEDTVKRVMRIKRKTHKLQSTDKSLKRWLLGLRPKLDNMKEKEKTVGAAFLWSSCFHVSIYLYQYIYCTR